MLKFYVCRICGNLVLEVEDGGNIPVCCGQQMSILKPASTEGSPEKHTPIVQAKDITSNQKAVQVSVVTVPHPSDPQHYIQWIALETSKNIYLHHLSPGEPPHAIFVLGDNEKVTQAYSYCNIHGLWIG